MNVTSVVGAAPEVSAPIREVGQSNSEVLFNWLAFKQKLWMLEDADHLDRFGKLVGYWSAIRIMRLFLPWRRIYGKAHPALRLPEDKAEIEDSFALLDKLLRAHFFGSEEKTDRGDG